MYPAGALGSVSICVPSLPQLDQPLHRPKAAAPVRAVDQCKSIKEKPMLLENYWPLTVAGELPERLTIVSYASSLPRARAILTTAPTCMHPCSPWVRRTRAAYHQPLVAYKLIPHTDGSVCKGEGEGKGKALKHRYGSVAMGTT